ncbi:D-alanyl-D-alanine carboxypeptidase/D-alanyl-D-alanine-endopeptidase [Rhodobacteraceae bacterium F11138]|nr:D-alanyl-D-alanine carboxypeptidase/D-alanyl-D-alanine-endopeptidase [Rhodobacteraceae bacterium F11138]
MSRHISRRVVLGGLGALLAPGAAVSAPPLVSLRPRLRSQDLGRQARGGVEGLIARAGLSGDVVCAVADVQSGLELEASGGARGLPPASVAKALTALYALDILGPDHRFVTRLLAAGPVQNGILKGDLILSGGGDPTLDTDDLADLARDLKEAGIHEVTGDFLVCETALPVVDTIDPDQPDHVGYSPAVSGLALNFNRVHFEWKLAGKRYAIAMDARTGKYRPDVEMARMKVVSRNVPVYTYADQDGVDQWTVARGALGGGGARWLPVRKPGAYAGDVFRTMARANGVVLKPARSIQRLPANTRVLARHQSAALQPILKAMLKYSNNLTAEMVGLSATIARGKRPADLKDSAAEMSRWARQTFGMTDTLLVDHSGLGDASRMTAQDLVGALVQARKQDMLRPMLKSFGLRDAKGRVTTTHPIKVVAKTGTLNFVSGLGGYMTAADGTELAFAIFAADTDQRARIPRAARERPRGARGWNYKAKSLQRDLIERWGALYGS